MRDDATGRRAGRIVEVEAYDGPDDLASHARFGSTDRNRVMFGRPGVAYVYLVYGMYDCLNVVVGPDGRPSAVLIRAVEPLAGVGVMRHDLAALSRRRHAGRTEAGEARTVARLARVAEGRLAAGPGLTAGAFGIDTGWTGTDLCDPHAALRLERDPADQADRPAADAIVASPRIGVAYAGEWAGVPWRFVIAGNRSVSGRSAG